jgi:hypothetical protein
MTILAPRRRDEAPCLIAMWDREWLMVLTRPDARFQARFLRHVREKTETFVSSLKTENIAERNAENIAERIAIDAEFINSRINF